ncbi:MarR family winged helix-turn-helix transcriptional regulator [Rhizobium helianthi]|uniref:MarR family winged helix-turn-helix transcriptional regulator n=1 Tax=Rhizobium helianthi TaxID=1132695 RepID=A0ABW4M7H0_9HYPH
MFAANGRLISAGNELVAHLGLTSAWWQVLGALRYSPVPLPAASIARNMGLTRQAVQRIVDVLEKKGLIEFQPNPHHRRAKLVVLTAAGLKAVTAAENVVAPLDQAISNKIGNDRLREAIKTLEEMGRTISDWLAQPQSQSPEQKEISS